MPPPAAALALSLFATPAFAQRIDTGIPPPPVRFGPAHELQKDETLRLPRKPALGVVLAPDRNGGVLIAGVTPGGAAMDAELRAGDRLVRIDGQPLSGNTGAVRLQDARRRLADLRVGTPVRVAYLRDGRVREASVVPRLADRVVVWSDGAGQKIRALGDFVVASSAEAGLIRAATGRNEAPALPRSELMQALRWNGLNLAALDVKLGKHFGTDRGVLVLSTGAGLAALQPGDVIRRIGGKPVDSPGEAMDVLRTQPAGSHVAIEYLRDRKPGHASVLVPTAAPELPPAP